MSDVEELSHKMDMVLFATEECADEGRFLFKTIKEYLAEISEFGATVKDLVIDEEDVTVEVLDALKHALEDLSERMQFHAEDFQEFKEEDNQYTEIVEVAMNLLKLMIGSLSTPGEINEEFRVACEETSPAVYGNKLLETLEADEENPLKKALEEDPEKFGEFLKWEEIIRGFLTQFLYIETYASGMFKEGNLDEANELKTKIEEFNKQWRGEEEEEEQGGEEQEEEEEHNEEEGGEEEEHQEEQEEEGGEDDGGHEEEEHQEEEQQQEEQEEAEKEHHEEEQEDAEEGGENYIKLFSLEDLRPMIESIQDANPRKTCDEKALMIQKEIEQLEAITGDDLFYVIVFKSSDSYVYHATIPDQVLLSANRGGCNVMVYRSREACNAGSQALKRMEMQVEGYKKLLRLLTLKLFVSQSEVDKWATREIENNGLVIAIKTSKDTAVRSTRTDILKWGPGWWIHDTVLLGLLLQQKYIILAGYK